MKPKIFVINLKYDVKKREHILDLCSNVGLKAKLIEATDGRLLSDSVIDTVYSKYKTIENIGRELSRSEVGCALSHKKVYQQMVDDNIERALILEDDVEFDESLISILTKAPLIAKKWDLILLGHHTGASRQVDTRSSYWGKKEISENFELVRPCE